MDHYADAQMHTSNSRASRRSSDGLMLDDSMHYDTRLSAEVVLPHMSVAASQKVAQLWQEERDRTRQLLWVEVPRPQYWFPEGVSKCRTLRRYAWAATRSLLPVIEWAPKTRWSSFRADLVAGLTVGVMLIPQSMSYARIAGLDSKYGMYSR